MTNKKSVGYTGSTPIEAGAFYAPYVPLQISQYGVPAWQNDLRKWTDYFNSHWQSSTAEIIGVVWQRMQDQYPGAYSVVIQSEPQDEPIIKTRYGPVSVKQVRLRLDFANPADETWWRLQYA